ncbi:uncharacterized protein E0L32_009417 [Thyridium curvatum]|uniref:Xylanolytic transcriptional activator regulatory domain-containing protein n=1 Tax=Thyridium curvatum TaxID=1093900 RepID=A0A507ANP6_9PEZI|nr:uncharacterized protein E0L32_009417 [Thyridium curvatum]TPX09373.1 hypothetical protein E0L32_009417 [Thyridium curvatum]
MEPAIDVIKIPRNYVSTLEAQVAHLTRENEELRARTPTSDPVQVAHRQDEANATTGSPAEPEDWMSTTLGRVVCEPSNQPRFIGVSSGITLARLVMAALQGSHVPAPGHQSGYQENQASARQETRASLPPRHAAEHLVDVYFQYQTAHFPIVDRRQVNQAVERAYSATFNEQSSSSKDVFTAYMVFAIALNNVHHPSGSRPPQSEDCFHSAISDIDRVLGYAKSHSDTLKVVLLLCQYVALCPSKGSLWLLTGLALRLALDLGLHWETGEHRQLEQALLDERRRLWYSTYLFDRLLCITLGRPFGITDQSTNVELPSLEYVQSQQAKDKFAIHVRLAQNHMIGLAQLESEIKHILYSHFRTSSIAYPKPDYATWIRDIEPRLQRWYVTVPSPSQAHPSSIFALQAYWDAIYNNALLLLYRPNPIVSQPSPEATCTSFHAACSLVNSVKILHRARKIDIMWKWVHHLFMAGLTVLYGLWQQQTPLDEENCSRITTLQRVLTGVGSAKESISILQSCSSTLSALAERWPAASGCRDVFETLSDLTIDWLVTRSAEDMQRSRLDFEKQLHDMQEQLPPLFPGGEADGSRQGVLDPLSLLSAGSFQFGETLSSAAEWPDFQDVDFDGFGFEAPERNT